MISASKNEFGPAIAIIGMVGKFPGSVTLSEFWSNLSQGKETISFFTEEEMLNAGVEAAQLANPNFVRARGVYKNPLHFDAPFFGYTPRDAELLDPQQRIFLECCWEALESAGYDPARFPGRIGVFAGSGVTHYLFEIMNRPEFRKVAGFNLLTANDKDYIATRIGHKLNMKGPCVTVQTACSTSLVATVLGCQSLLTYQADMILAGGASVHPVEIGGYEYTEGGIVSPDGHCRSFDAAAKGTVFGAGAGVLVLKRLEDALPSDKIYAVIRGFGLNNDGSRRAGFTAPGVDGQTAVTTEALTMSGINPETVSYVECHGTGTNLGDPIEIKALSLAFGAFTQKKNFCAIGSVKSNIGHTDAAAGVAGMIKTVLSIHHRAIPPSLHFQNPNPEIQFEDTPFFVNTALREWKSDGPLRAGVNSFGVGGTNAHVVLEEPPALPATSESRPWQLLLWSARTPTALDNLTGTLGRFLSEEPAKLADVCFTHQVGRQHFDHRRFLVCQDRQSAGTALCDPQTPRVVTLHSTAPAPRTVFLFPGQGAQYVNMAHDLYETESEFRSVFDRCADLFQARLGQDIRRLIYPDPQDSEKAGEFLQQTKFTQPALFAVEYALAKLWETWGVKPGCAIGHSIGEYVAACLAGVLSLEDATALVASRGSLMQTVPPGSMLSILLPEAEVAALLKGHQGISIATVNGPSACVVSGLTSSVDIFAQTLTAKKIPNRRLKTSHAFHSAMMDPILPEFLKQVKAVKLSAPRFPYLSNLTGTWIKAEEATDPGYWVQHLRHAVKFSAGVSELLRGQKRLVFLEVGPGRSLSSLVTQQAGRDGRVQVVSSLPGATEQGPGDVASALQALGQMWGAGIEPDWDGFYSRESRRRTLTVTYPFERQQYGKAGVPVEAPVPEKPEKSERRDFDDWFSTVNWTRTLPLTPAPAPEAARCLLFCDPDSPIGDGLRGRGFEVVEVHAGTHYAANAGSFTLSPGIEGDYEALMYALTDRNFTPSHVVYAWGLGDNRPEAEHCDELLERNFYGPLFLVKNLARGFADSKLPVTFVSNQVFDVVGNEKIGSVAAATFGPVTSAAREYKNLVTRIVDVAAGDRERTELGQLLDEITNPSAEPQVVALRGGHRWIREFMAIRIADAQPGQGLRESGVYLITGGLRGLGRASAHWIAQQVKAKFALIGRSALPPRETWPSHLNHGGVDDPAAERIRTVLALEELGSEVLVLDADVADPVQMQQAVDRVRAQFGRIHGVIHSAGLAGEGIIDFKQKQAADAVLRPKIQGSIILYEILKDEALDFFLLYSSLTGLVGSAGQVDYTAGNAFMDAFAWSKRRSKNRVVSIDWDRWDEVGMGARRMREAIAKETGAVEGKEEILTHPVFAKRIVGNDHETYMIPVSAETHWVAGEHRIMGSPTMVGTSHLEHIRAAYAHSEGIELVEIRDLMFIQPVMLRPGEQRDVYYTLLPARDGRRDFSVWSNDNGAHVDHARGRIGQASGDSGKRYDGAGILSRCANARKPVLAEGVSTNGDEALVALSSRWAIFERIGDSEVEAIAKIRLSDVHAADAATYLMHPAVLDCATSYASGPAIQHMYLPLAYRRLQVYKPLPQVLYSYKQFKTSATGNQEILSCDVTLFDEAGEPVIEIEDFTVKRVGDPNALGPRKNGHHDAGIQKTSGGQDTSAIEKRFGKRITPAEGLRALHRIISGPWMPQVVVNALDPDLAARAEEAHDEAMKGVTGDGDTGRLYPRPSLETPYVAPRTELEAGIAEIWQAVLGIDKVGVQDNFVELGGHSLLAIQVTSRISETFGIEVSIADFYQHSTVEGLAQSLLIKLTEGLQESSLDELLAAEPATSEAAMA
jgi:phthiocerol/phenolphthiocerol synthesis type-I polyketide synthase E